MFSLLLNLIILNIKYKLLFTSKLVGNKMIKYKESIVVLDSVN